MTHYNRHYTSGDRAADDEAAIADIREYLSQTQWDAMMQLVGHPETSIQHVNLAFGITGVQGYPFHAFCRKYLLEKYRAWMAEAPECIETDEQGFSKEAEAA